MLVVSIAVKDYYETRQILQSMQEQSYLIEVVEFRLDYLIQAVDLEMLKQLSDSFSGPKIFTIRNKAQGGYFRGDQQEWMECIEKVAMLEPDYLDLEYDTPIDFIKKIHLVYPEIKLIASYHNFTHTVENLDKLLAEMKRPEFYAYKIAVQANSTIDTVRMLEFVYRNNQSTRITGICMGQLGEATRILAPVVGGYFTFASLSDETQTANGQLTIETLYSLFCYQRLNSKTAIYALLGDPVKQSIGDTFHNRIFSNLGKNAVYLKLLLKVSELGRFFYFAKKIPFCGFSITMPLKEKILPYVDECNGKCIGVEAVNTIAVRSGKYFGFNTDGIGALDAIETETSVKNKKMLIIGAGGTARAIAYEALCRDANVTIINRTESKAKKLASKFGCNGCGLNYLDKKFDDEKFDILVNATPVGMKKELLPINIKRVLISTGIVLDMIVSNEKTPLVRTANKAGFQTLPGKLAFVMQAMQQQILWVSPF